MVKIPNTKLETTVKVSSLRLKYTDAELCKKIGITKPTLYSRIAQHKWKLSEIYLIQTLQ